MNLIGVVGEVVRKVGLVFTAATLSFQQRFRGAVFALGNETGSSSHVGMSEHLKRRVGTAANADDGALKKA